MNKYLDFLLKNFGGADKSGIRYISTILNDYNIEEENISIAYAALKKNDNLEGSCERCIRHYISWCTKKYGIEKVESILGCKRDKNDRFSNKSFMLAMKFRVEAEEEENV